MADGNYKFYPYISTEVAFLGFIEDFNNFNKNNNGKVYLRNGPKDPTSGLRPREILGLIIIANVAMFESGDEWVPGWLVDTDGKSLPERTAHDGVIRCTSGPRKGAYMHFEQTMATLKDKDASPHDIESAILRVASRKANEGEDYIRGTVLIILVDYVGRLKDLRKLSGSVSESPYSAVYLIGIISEQFRDFICVTLKSPSDKIGPIAVKFNRPDGIPDVARMYD
jgi:hypothetical protein